MTFGLIIPVYGDPSVMGSCFESVLRQSRPFDEVVIVDDASPDAGVAALTREYAELGGWRVIRLQCNGGIVAASNVGLEACTTDYVAFLDCDDTLSPVANERMRVAAKESDSVDALFSRYATFSDNAPAPGDRRNIASSTSVAPSELVDPGLFELREYYEDDQHLVLEHLFCSHFKMFRSGWLRSVGGFPPRSDGVQDWFIGVRAVHDARVSFVPEILYYHRIHQAQTTNSARAHFLRAVNSERRRRLMSGRASVPAEVGRQVLSVAQRLSRSDALDVLPSFLLVSQSGRLRMYPAILETLDGLADHSATEWIIVSGNSWFHLGASKCFAANKVRPYVGIAVRSDCNELIHMCRWYAGYADFVVCLDAASDLLLSGYLPRDVPQFRVSVPEYEEPYETSM